MLHRLSSATALTFLLAGSLSAQIMAPRGSLQAQRNAPPLLVATPYTASAADSAAAVEIGIGLRERMSKSVVGRDYNVITREKMNEAFATYGYPADAMLTADGARTFAQNVGATRMMLMSNLHKNPDGRYRLVSRLIGTYNANDMAGFVVEKVQEPGQKLEDFGEKMADEFKPAIKALKESTGCYDNMFTDEKKAAEAAEKAFKIVPDWAPAEFCLGQIALRKDSASATAEQYFQDALSTDPQSLKSYDQLGVIYQKRADSSKVISTYQQMLRIDPLNQPLRELAFDLFRAYGSQDAAEEVADEGIRTDPANTDWYDLKSNACLAQEKFGCAVDELETFFTIDSTKADTAFFKKINLAARFGDDTVRYAKWAEKGIEKFPDNVALLQDAGRAFAMSGNADGAVDVTRRLLAIDPSDYEPLRVTAVTLANAGQHDRLLEFIPMVKASGDEDLQNTFGNLLVNGASKVFSTNSAQADTLSQAALDAGTTDGRLLAYANYFIGAHLFGDIRTLSTSVRESKSCEDGRRYLAILQRAKPAMEGAALSTDDRIKNFAAQTLPSIESELAAMPELVRTFCR